jgi:hypothetical protein
MNFQKLIFENKMYFKVLNETLKQHNFQYQLGLNIDSNLFDDKECQNGLHFCTLENVPRWLGYGSKLAFVSIPEDAKILHFDDKSKADKLVIEKIIDLKDWEMWKNEEFCSDALFKNNFATLYVKNRQYYTVFDETLTHDDQKYSLGLNIISPYYTNSKSISFYTAENIHFILGKKRNPKLAFVTIPNDAKISYFSDANLTNKLFIEKIINIEDWEMWKDEEFCRKIVKHSGFMLKYIVNQTDEICLEAVKENGYALKFVDKQTEEICLEAVKRNEFAFKYVKNQTEKICLEALKKYGTALRFVEDQTETVCLEAIKQTLSASKYIRNPTKTILEEIERLKNLEDNSFFKRCSIV